MSRAFAWAAVGLVIAAWGRPNERDARARGRTASGEAGPPPSAMVAQTLLEEDFEDGVLPGGWLYRQARTGGDSLPGSWFIAPTDPEVAIGEGRYMAWVNWDTTEAADEWMITPRVDLSDSLFEEVSLRFLRVYHDPSAWADSSTLVVRVSRDDGASFPDTVYRVATHSRAGRQWVSVDLSRYVGTATVRIAFQYEGRGGDSAGVDDVRVETGLPVSVRRRTWGSLKLRDRQD